MDKLKLACLAGANAIETNKRLIGAKLTTGDSGSISFYRAEILLRLFAACINGESIDMEKLRHHIDKLDEYEIVRGEQDG